MDVTPILLNEHYHPPNWTISATKVPSWLEPYGLLTSDGKRSGGMCLELWSSCQSVVQDTTCPDTLAVSLQRSSHQLSWLCSRTCRREKVCQIFTPCPCLPIPPYCRWDIWSKEQSATVPRYSYERVGEACVWGVLRKEFDWLSPPENFNGCATVECSDRLRLCAFLRTNFVYCIRATKLPWSVGVS